VFNRTRSKVDELVADFRDYDVTIVAVESLDAIAYIHGPPIFVIGTVPAKGTALPGRLAEGGIVELSHGIFSRPEGGVMLDMAYLPKRTPLIQVAEKAQGWGVYPGILVLLGQAFAQFKIWTGVTPPEAAMTEATLEEYEKDISGTAVSG
jgi:pentafunctional AROM polypeptide